MNPFEEFRVFDKGTGKHIIDIVDLYIDILKVEGKAYRIGYDDCPTRYAIEPYTGRRDKNGKKIYLGDVVEWDKGDGEYRPYLVVWQNKYTRFCLYDPEAECQYEDLEKKKEPYLKVVGHLTVDETLQIGAASLDQGGDNG